MKKYLLFDLDGTLTNSYLGISRCILYALEKLGYPKPSEETLKKCIGPTLVYSFSNFFGMERSQAELAQATYRERYHEVGWKENELYEGVLEGVKKLKEAGYTLALATGKPAIFAGYILEFFGLAPYFSAVSGSELDGRNGTKEEEIKTALARLNAKAEEAIMIGDRKYDILGAKACHLTGYGVSYGFAEAGELEGVGAEKVFESFSSLTRFLLDEM